MAGLQLALTIIVGFLAAVHDYDFAFKLKDFLHKRDSPYTLLMWAADCALSLAAGASGLGSGMELAHLCNAAVRMYEFWVQMPFYSRRICALNV